MKQLLGTLVVLIAVLLSYLLMAIFGAIIFIIVLIDAFKIQKYRVKHITNKRR